MTTFDRRKDAYENKFAHDEELRFRSEARRNKLLGLWAAEKLGFAEEKAAQYANAVVASDFDEPGDEDVFRKVRADFDEAGVTLSDQELREKMLMLMGEAIKQIEDAK
uniref:DUF1476 domain-containing protein n=1 Tax=Pararhizobium sp. IMCC3301 TaxID=3067904 RepID=UPI002741C51F|nr:DUF1476 domain-containing protein [Pararhizobium sp. IMCC3301]